MDLFKKNINSSVIPMIRISGNVHGSHWQCINPDFNIIKDFLRTTVKLESLSKFYDPPFADMGKHSVGGHKGNLHNKLSTITLMVEIQNKHKLASAYPILWSENRVHFRLENILEWPIQIEANLNGTLGEANLTFFPVDFFFNRDYYLSDQIKDISLGIFAYEQRTNSWAGKTVERQGQIYKLDQAEMIFPLWKGNGPPDDYLITGKVQKIEHLTIFNEPCIISTIRCKPINNIDVFCLTKNMDKSPVVGDMIQVNGWLQGREPNEVWNEMGPIK